MQNKMGILLSVMTALFLTGCGDHSSSLDNYIRTVKARNPSRIDPLPRPIPYQQFAYPKTQARDPFVKTIGRHAMLGRPDLSRPKQPLEAFAIDSLRMVGTVMQDNKLWAIIAAPDGVVYRVSAGSYVGQNFGVIKIISSKDVQLEESFENNGAWERRPAKLMLVEGES